MNHNRVEDTAPRYADSSDQGSIERESKGGGERAKTVWEEEMEKDGLDEENGIKRIQMEELETDTHTQINKQRYI